MQCITSLILNTIKMTFTQKQLCMIGIILCNTTWSDCFIHIKGAWVTEWLSSLGSDHKPKHD